MNRKGWVNDSQLPMCAVVFVNEKNTQRVVTKSST